jgi:hypothetical protein
VLLHTWLTGKIKDDAVLLFGMKAFWWARTGKLVQLLSGSVILLNIITVERLKLAGQRVGEMLPWRMVFSWPRLFRRERLKRRLESERAGYIVQPEVIIEYFDLGAGSEVRPNPDYDEAANEHVRIERARVEREIHRLGPDRPDLLSRTLVIFGLLSLAGWIYINVHFHRIFYTTLNSSEEFGGLFMMLISIVVGGLFAFVIGELVSIFILVLLIRLPLFLLSILFIRPVSYILSFEGLEKSALEAVNDFNSHL